MLQYKLQEPAVLFDCVDPLDEAMQGNEVARGLLVDMVAEASQWFDGRLAGARIVTADGSELFARDIEDLDWAAAA